MKSKKIPKIAAIYILINLINNHIYIGKANNLKKRIGEHIKCYDEQIIHSAIKKYGWDNFKLEILHSWDFLPDKFEMLALETAFIDEYESLVQFGKGYNVCLFASDRTGVKASPKTLKKISKENHFMWGKHHSEETKKLMSKNSGKPMLGKHHSKESKQKIRESTKGKIFSKETLQTLSIINKGEKNPMFGKRGELCPFFGIKRSEITKNKISKNHAHKRKIKQINKITGEIIKIWDSILEAAKTLNICNVAIGNVLHNKTKTSGGFKWEFV